MLLWFLALFHILHTITAWGLLLALPLAFQKHTKKWLRASYRERWFVDKRWHSMAIFLAWILLSILTLNYLSVIRPFPIGWDDLGRYINGPRQISLYGQIIPTMSTIQWEYVTALGYLLFGYSSNFSATTATGINWLSGLFAVLAIFTCTRALFGPGTGILAALFYYTLPMVGHFSFADMKTENALLFFGAVGLIAVFEYLSEKAHFRSDLPTEASAQAGGLPAVAPPERKELLPQGQSYGGQPSQSEGWCRRRDSNPHTRRYVLLRHACLPIPPLRHIDHFSSS